MRRAPMFEYVNALPSSKRQPPIDEWNRNLGLRKRSANMRGHVVCSLRIVPIERLIIRRQARQERVEIRQHIRVGVLLDQQRGRGMANEEGEQPGGQPLPFCPSPHLVGRFMKSATGGALLDLDRRLPHLGYQYA